MNAIHPIRQRLNMTQAELAKAVCCSQSNIARHELSPEKSEPSPALAMRLASYASLHGLAITMDHVYGVCSLPEAKVRKKRGRKATPQENSSPA